MISIKRKIKAKVEKRKNDGILITKNVPIFLRLTYNGIRINLYSGFRIDLDKWNEDEETVITKTSNSSGESAEEINLKINHYKNELQTFFIECQLKERIPTKNEVINFFKSLKNKGTEEFVKNTTPKRMNEFFNVFDIFIKDQGKVNNWTEGTKKKFNTLRSHLEDFNPNLSFDDLNTQGLTEFMSYFFKLDLRNTTTKKYIKNLKWFLRYAERKGFTINDDFENFNPKLKDTDKKIVFLSEVEIELIKHLKIPNTQQYLHRVRDILLFTCYTGLRYSDVQKLKKSDIKNNKIELLTKKTNDLLTIELNETSRKILEKYEQVEMKNNLALPVITNQKTNVFLKQIGELAEINEPITQYYYIGSERYEHSMPKYEYFSSHLGRRTFICLCISRNIPIQVIMKWTGHSDYQSMKPYIDVVDATKEIEMQKLN